jgi:hypothetical protein
MVVGLPRATGRNVRPVLLSGHDRGYERLEPLSPDAIADPDGPRQFVVGTIGVPLPDFNAAHPGSVLRSPAHGVLRLELSTATYRWQFMPTEPTPDADNGAASCR